ncbi:MAG TPA: MFS transporter [Polyangiaceae bacterium]|nr:MFS transporter [Polyangiaceae bacterium]
MTATSTIAPRAALSFPSFRYFQAARFLSVLSLEMQSVAVGWQLYQLTGRPLDLGLAGLAQFLPGVLLVPWTGRTADRVRRERIVRACHFGGMVCNCLLLALSAFSEASAASLYAVLLLSGVVRAFTGPASQALVPLLVPKVHFPNAVAWGSSVFQAANILGPTLGGALYAITHSPQYVYSMAAVGFASAGLLVSFVRPVNAQVPSGGRGLSELLGGFRCVWSRRIILGVTTLDLFAVLLGGAVALLPVYAKEVLGIGPWGFGILRSAPGIGAVSVAVLVAFYPLKRHAGPIMLACVAGFGFATVIFGLSRSFALSLLALLLVGATDMVSVIVRGTVVQLSTPDDMRGRVSSVNMLFIGASNELGQFESGVLAQWLGAVPAVVIGGVGAIGVVILWSFLFPELRRVDRMTDIRDSD